MHFFIFNIFISLICSADCENKDTMFIYPQRDKTILMINHSFKKYVRHVNGRLDLLIKLINEEKQIENSLLCHENQIHHFRNFCRENNIFSYQDLLNYVLNDNQDNKFTIFLNQEIESIIGKFLYSKKDILQSGYKINFADTDLVIKILIDFKENHMNSILTMTHNSLGNIKEKIYEFTKSMNSKFIDFSKNKIDCDFKMKSSLESIIDLSLPHSSFIDHTLLFELIKEKILHSNFKEIKFFFDYHADQFLFDFYEKIIDKSMSSDINSCNIYLEKILNELTTTFYSESDYKMCLGSRTIDLTVYFIYSEKLFSHDLMGYFINSLTNITDDSNNRLFNNIYKLETALPKYFYNLLRNLKFEGVYFQISPKIYDRYKFNISLKGYFNSWIIYETDSADYEESKDGNNISEGQDCLVSINISESTFEEKFSSCIGNISLSEYYEGINEIQDITN